MCPSINALVCLFDCLFFSYESLIIFFFDFQASSDLPIGSSAATNANKALFLEKVKLSNTACQNGDFEKAVSLYSEAIQLDPNNHILYSNRSAAYIKMGHFSKALKDAIKAKELSPDWPKAYYR